MGILLGLVVDAAMEEVKQEYCKCGEAVPGGYAALGAAGGYFGPFDQKPRKGIGGGGPAGDGTSVFSSQVGAAHGNGSISTGTRNKLRKAGRRVARGIPLLGSGLLAYDIYELVQCVRNSP